jgi:hypothetical protein
MTTPLSYDAERVYKYLVEYITAKNNSPSKSEIAKAVGSGRQQERRWRVRLALQTLQRAGKIRLIEPRNGRPDIKLAALPSQEPLANPAHVTVDTAKADVSCAALNPGAIICVQCKNPVYAKSKWYCEFHLRLNREAVKRSRGRKARAGETAARAA